MNEIRISIENNLSYKTVKNLLSGNKDPKSRLTLVLTKEKLDELLKEYRNEIIDEIRDKIFSK